MTKRAEIENFRELCRREFCFLEQEYGFTERKLPTKGFINQFQVQYVTAMTLVAVEGISYGHGIDVWVGRVEPEAWETMEHYRLEDLLRFRCPELSLVGPDGFQVSSDQMFQLKHYARALKVCAEDVLRGEFLVLPQLHQAVERWVAERRAKLFTSGEA